MIQAQLSYFVKEGGFDGAGLGINGGIVGSQGIHGFWEMS